MPADHAIASKPLGIAATLGACLLLGACGGSGSPSTSNAPTGERADEQKLETRFADFARCLREHGVNAEAISHPGGGHGLKIMPGSAGNGPAAMEAAEHACARYRPEQQQRANLSPQQKVELEERAQRFAKCMRQHGIKVEVGSGGGVLITISRNHGDAPNPESPAFRTAQRSCQKLLPGGGP